MKIAIITDGSSALGMGHVYQSITLANDLSKKIDINSNIIFLTKSEQNVVNQLSEAGFKVNQYPDDSSIFNSLIKERPHRILFDKLDVSPSLAKQIKDTIPSKLIILTNLTDANKYADITVLADIGSNFKNICEKDPLSGKTHFFGPKYWIMRPEFFEYSMKPKKSFSNVKKIMLIFGGSDQANFTSDVLNILLCMEKKFEILVVIGAAFKHKDKLDAVIKENINTQSSFEIFYNLKTVAKAMHESDVVFASPGLSFFEALAVGTPVLGFHQNELQRDVYKGYLTTLDKTELFKLPLIIENKAFFYPDNPFIESMQIAQGKNEIIDAILS